MSLAADTRDAAREHPFLLDALRAGVLNHTAAADFLDLEGDRDAVATALRRFAEDLDDYATDDRHARVTMQSGVEAVDGDGDDTETLLSLGGTVVADGGSQTAVLASGDVDAASLVAVLERLAVASIDVDAAAVAGATLLVLVGRRDGASAVRAVESALSAVPTRVSRPR
jgi:Arc/MetJ family transcription regulator